MHTARWRIKREALLTDTDLLHGPLLGKIFAFVLPLMITNLIQNLYNAADMVIVGMSDVDGAIGAIGTTAAMVNCILNLFMGFAVGASVMVARAIGERNPDKTTKAVHTALVIGMISGIAAMVLGLFISRPILILLGDQGHILELAHLYTKIYFIGVPFIAVTNFFISIFRAKGDTKTPLVILTITGLLNVVLNLLFVVAFHMSVDGVALATTISNLASMIALAMVLRKDKGWCRLELRKLRIEKYALKGIIYNGFPAAIQGVLFSLSNMIIQSSIININNRQFPGGSDIIDGNAAGQSIESFAYVATNSVCQAAVTFTSQHYGGKKYHRMGKVIRDCYIASFMIAEIMSLSILFLRIPLAHIYLDSPHAIEACSIRLLHTLSAYFTLASMDTGSGIVRGLNRSIMSTVVSLLGSCVLRIIWIMTLARIYPTLGMVYISYPISWAITGLCHFIVAMTVKNRMLKEHPVDED
ncbi:MAG: MATE family efflux transporter [Spirochaetales bacterium]|nr:MATE family efflux transporter [Spirochaetales bacterium]